MIDFEKLPYFEEFIDPETGVKSYILKQDQAKCTQSFYFTNQSMSADQKYLWMYCFFPPMEQQCLGVVSLDPENPFVRVFKEAIFTAETPLVAPAGDKVYFANRYGRTLETGQICTIDVDGNIEEFARLPKEITNGRVLYVMGTHLTISADGKDMLVDVMVGGQGMVTLVDMETRQFRVVNEYMGFYDHAQFSPVDPEHFIMDQDGWNDPYSGQKFVFKNRIWLCDRAATQFEPINQRSWFAHDGSKICHDFWSFDGHICWIDYDKGAFEMDPETREVFHVWKHPVCHAHCNGDRMLWVADQTPYAWQNGGQDCCRLMFFNRKTGKSVDVYSAMPAPPVDRGPWHIDPHPQFTPDGNYIVSTTTVHDQVAISITPVEQLIEKTK